MRPVVRWHSSTHRNHIANRQAQIRSGYMALQGFSEKESTGGKRLLLSIEGMPGKGKSTLALSAPGPIALFDFDTGLEGVVEKFLDEGKKIYIPDESLKHGDTQDPKVWDKMWQSFKVHYFRALDCKDIRTVVIDTATEAWELVRLAEFGKLSQVLPHSYGPVNAEFRRLLRRAYDSDKNLILIHKLKPKYVNDKRTDEYEMSGFSGTPYDVQCSVRVWRHRRDVDGDVDFGMTVLKCRPNAEVEDEELVQPMSNFAFLAATVFPDTDVEDWI